MTSNSNNNNNCSSPSSFTSSPPASPTSAASLAAANAAAAATAAAMLSSSLYLPQTYSFLSPETFETLVEGYINQLHIRKRNKALINQQLANDCLMVLTNPENTAIFNPKFRWWVRKHFVFTVVGELRILMDKKNGKPVCVREQLYDKVCYFHHIIGHGGRDKTFAAITKSYSKVPAELVSLFTKNCQTCLGVRKYSKNKRPILNEFEYPGHQQTTPQPQPQPQHTQQQQQQQQYHHHVQQQQQQQASHHPHLQLTCNTNFSSLGGHHHNSSQQSAMHNMMTTKTEHGTISPISPMMHHSGSGFFGSNGHLHSAYSQAAAAAAVAQSQQQHHHQQQQQQQLQQQHHAALTTHLNMSMSLSDMSLGGHLNSASSTDDAPSILSKMELPLHQLMHSGHHHHNTSAHHHHHSMMTSGLHSPTDMPEHHFLPQQEASPEASSVGDYSPTLSHQYLHQQQQQQQQQQTDYSQSFSSYSAALSLSAYQQHQHHAQQQQQQQQQQEQSTPSPILSQAQLFQKQIQHEHHRFQQQQQQHRFLSDGLMGADLITTSSAASAVPSMHITTSFSAAVAAAAAAAVSSIPTPTSASPLSNLLDDHEDHHQQHQQVELTVNDL